MTGGVNVIATPAEIAGGAGLGGFISIIPNSSGPKFMTPINYCIRVTGGQRRTSTVSSFTNYLSESLLIWCLPILHYPISNRAKPSVSHLYLALDGIYHPLRAAIPNNSTR